MGDYHAATAAMDSVEAGAGLHEDVQLVAELPFLEGCEPLEIQVLSKLLETHTCIYGEKVVSHGERPAKCYILSSGHCRMRSRGGVSLGDLRPGAWFGVGALGNRFGFCCYQSEVDIVVETSSATWRLLSVKALSMLPDVAQLRIQDRVGQTEDNDPIRDDGMEAIRQHAAWTKSRRAIVAEENRCSVRGGVPRGMP